MSRRRMALLIAAAAVPLLMALLWLGHARGDPLVGPFGSRLSGGGRAPRDVRIRVEVLNASSRRGLARQATLHLRDRGFDVVGIGNAPESRDSTLVIDRIGRPEWARLVGDALGGSAVESRPDSSRYVDVTVLLGATWRPPPEPFHP